MPVVHLGVTLKDSLLQVGLALDKLGIELNTGQQDLGLLAIRVLRESRLLGLKLVAGFENNRLTKFFVLAYTFTFVNVNWNKLAKSREDAM